MEKVPQEELLILGQGRINEQMVMDLIGFNRRYQNRLLRYFAKIKIQFEEEHPGLCYPGLFAEVDSISGATRPPHEQKVWSWCDCRGLGIWSYLLAKGVISDDEAVTLPDWLGEWREVTGDPAYLNVNLARRDGTVPPW